MQTSLRTKFVRVETPMGVKAVARKTFRLGVATVAFSPFLYEKNYCAGRIYSLPPSFKN